jgi:hypothetical protein
MPRVPPIPIGRSRLGLATSPARVVTLSNPMKEKKTVPAPLNEPSKPNGKNGSQLLVSISVAPKMMTNKMIATLRMVMPRLKRDEFLTPNKSSNDIATTMPAARMLTEKNAVMGWPESQSGIVTPTILKKSCT